MKCSCVLNVVSVAVQRLTSKHRFYNGTFQTIITLAWLQLLTKLVTKKLIQTSATKDRFVWSLYCMGLSSFVPQEQRHCQAERLFVKSRCCHCRESDPQTLSKNEKKAFKNGAWIASTLTGALVWCRLLKAESVFPSSTSSSWPLLKYTCLKILC